MSREKVLGTVRASLVAKSSKYNEWIYHYRLGACGPVKALCPHCHATGTHDSVKVDEKTIEFVYCEKCEHVTAFGG